MSIYVPTLREKLQNQREENSEMQREIDTLVEQRDNEMKINERRLFLLQRERMFLWREGYYFCVFGEEGYWKKRPSLNFICECETY